MRRGVLVTAVPCAPAAAFVQPSPKPADVVAEVRAQEQVVDAMRTSSCTVKSVALRDVHVVVASPYAAVIAYRAVVDGACDGKPLPPAGELTTSVWARRGGRWLTIAHQQTPAAR